MPLTLEFQETLGSLWPRSVALSKSQPPGHSGSWEGVCAMAEDDAVRELQVLVVYDVITHEGLDVSWELLRCSGLRHLRASMQSLTDRSDILSVYEEVGDAALADAGRHAGLTGGGSSDAP